MRIAKLREQIHLKSPLVLLLGAGASVESGGRTADGVAYGILERIYGPKVRQELNAEYKREFGRDVSFENVLDSFGSDQRERRRLVLEYFSEMRPSAGYITLAQMLRAGFFNGIVLTTNFDAMLEDALSTYPDGIRSKTRIITGDDVAEKLSPAADEILIVKLHGDIREGKHHTLKMTFTQTHQLTTECEALLSRLCDAYGLVVIGYRVSDRGVQTGLLRSGSNRSPIYWIGKEPPDRQNDPITMDILLSHDSLANTIAETFDAFFEGLGKPYLDSAIRGRFRREIYEAWRALDTARDFGAKRSEILSHLSKQTEELQVKTGLDECLALHEFVRFEIDRSGETYRLQSGVQHLELANNQYGRYLSKQDRDEMEHALFVELLNLFLTGDVVPGGRTDHLQELIELARRRYAEIAGDIMLRTRTGLVLAEALKELAMITAGSEHRNLFEEARTICESCIQAMKEVENDEARRMLGTAFRHGAVTFELEGDLQSDNDIRRRLYDSWRNWSDRAVQILSSIGEDRVCAYALLNRADSKTRLADSAYNNVEKHKLLRSSREDLEEGRIRLQRVEDTRGLGWHYIHLCANLRKSLEIATSTEDRKQLSDDLESAGNRAVGMVRRGNDQLGQGLAYKAFGEALLAVSKFSEPIDIVKLKRATEALREAIRLLENTAYYRGEGETAAALSECHFALWRRTNNEIELVLAFEALVKGLLSTARDLGNTESLRPIYETLEGELRKLVV